MASKLIFLGTAGDIYVTAKQHLSSAGFVLKVNDLQFFIDPGPGALARAALNNIDVRETTAIIASHAHINHSADVNSLIHAITYNGLDSNSILIGNKTVFEGMQGYEKVVSDFCKKAVEKAIILEKNHRIAIEDVEIVALPAIHTDPNTIGLKFITDDFILSYSSDTKYNKELANYYKGSDILILNTVLPKEEKNNYNLSIDDAIKIIKQAKPKATIITHFGIKLFRANPMYEARRIQQETSCQVIMAKDGMQFNPLSYSALSEQKRLLSFKKDKQE